MDFISLDVARSLGLKLEPSSDKLSVKLADGSSLTSSHVVNNVCLQLGDHVEMRTLRVLPMNNIQVILGKPWLHDINPVIDWHTHTFQLLEHADVRRPPRATATEHEADTGPPDIGRCVRRLGFGRCRNGSRQNNA